MTKENFINKWASVYNVSNTINPYFISDLDALIATEIAKAKVQPEKTNKIEITPHTLVEVNRAFRALKQDRNSYIHKVFSDDGVFDAMEEIRKMFDNYFVEQPQEAKPAHNPIAEAYERGEKIRRKNWYITHWIKKYSDTEAIDEPKNIYDVTNWAFRTEPHEWELYTEPADQVTDQVSDQVQNAKPFDKERFEAMFRAVVASGRTERWEQDFKFTEEALAKLDAYYASKEKGGKNG